METSLPNVISKAQVIFPKLQIGYKDSSLFMKILGHLLWFNKGFMTDYATTIGNTMYFPSQDYIKNADIGTIALFLHELTHIYDKNRISGILYTALYIFPQLLALLSLVLMFFCPWYITVLPLLCLLPIPAYFRMLFERKAYTIQLYIINKYDRVSTLDFYSSQFQTSAYYYMWPFSSMNAYFSEVWAQIKAGQKPVYESEIYDMVDKLVSS